MHKHLNPALSASKQSYISTNYVIDCSLGVNPFGPPPQVTKYAENYDGSALSEYYDYRHIVSLTQKLSDYVDVDGANIFLANGSFNLLTTVFFKLLRGGAKQMLGVGPQFVDAIGEWTLSGGAYTSVPLRLDAPDQLPLDALSQALSTGKFAVMYLDNPNNPTGAFFRLDQVRALAQRCRDAGTILLIDEAYADFVDLSESGFSLVHDFENVLVIRSFSKGFGLASIRLGYVGVHPSMADHFRAITTPFRCAHFSLGAASAALDDLSHLVDCRAKTRRYKARMSALLAKVGIDVLPSHSDVPIFVAHQSGVDLHQRFAAQSVITEAGSCFAPTDVRFDDSYCRVRIPGSEHHFAHLAYRLR